MAGIFGAPAAAGLITVTKQANDAFGEPGKLQELKPLAREQREMYLAMTCATAVSPSYYRRTQAFIETRCAFCGVKHDHDTGTCTQCGAPL